MISHNGSRSQRLLTPVVDSHGMVVSLLQQIIFGMLLSLGNKTFNWKLNALDIHILGLVAIRPALEDFASIDRNSCPSILCYFVVAHVELRSGI